jgi:beta-lactamase regulating signal transducer with metallopeptidase domain
LLPGSIFFWFHPLQWLFDRWQSDLHEYEVDAAMIEKIPTKTYALQLIQSSLSLGPAWLPRLFSSSLKKRIYRMTNSLTPRSFKSNQFLALLGLILILAVACSDLKEDITTSPLNSKNKITE